MFSSMEKVKKKKKKNVNDDMRVFATYTVKSDYKQWIKTYV